MNWLTKLKAQYIPYCCKGDMGYFLKWIINITQEVDRT
nr:MAG TPA: hypothetical protein [Caudoviricetes sp.]